MRSDTPESADAVPASPGFAAFCFWLWSLGALSTHWIGIWPGIGGAALILGALALTLHRRTLAPLLRAGPHPVRRGLLGAAVLLAATYLLYQPAGLLPFDIPGQTSSLYGRFRDAPSLLTIVLLPVCILSEELIWRGIVQQALATRWGAGAGVLLGALAYGAAHAPVGAPLLLVVALGCGAFWGFMRQWSGSLIPGLICHAAWDVMVFSLVPLVR